MTRDQFLLLLNGMGVNNNDSVPNNSNQRSNRQGNQRSNRQGNQRNQQGNQRNQSNSQPDNNNFIMEKEEEVLEEYQPDHVSDIEWDDMLEDSHEHIVHRLYIKLNEIGYSIVSSLNLIQYDREFIEKLENVIISTFGLFQD